MHILSRSTPAGAAVREIAERLEKDHQDLSELNYQEIVQHELNPTWGAMPEGSDTVMATLLVSTKEGRSPAATLSLHTARWDPPGDHHFKGEFVMKTETHWTPRQLLQKWTWFFRNSPQACSISPWSHIDPVKTMQLVKKELSIILEHQTKQARRRKSPKDADARTRAAAAPAALALIRQHTEGPVQSEPQDQP